MYITTNHLILSAFVVHARARNETGVAGAVDRARRAGRTVEGHQPHGRDDKVAA